MPFDDTEKNLRKLERAISPERLKPYLIRARGDLWVALQLYRRNTELSEALYGVVQGYEVFLRNASHGQLAKGSGRDDWWQAASLRDRERNDIEEAARCITERAVPVTVGRMVAQLNLGFWTNLYSNFYEHQFWVPQLRTLFPISMQRKRLHDRMEDLKTLRNRIAHHETLQRRDVRQDYLNLIETIGWMSPTVRLWVEGTNCFEERFAKRIPKRVVTETKETV